MSPRAEHTDFSFVPLLPPVPLDPFSAGLVWPKASSAAVWWPLGFPHQDTSWQMCWDWDQTFWLLNICPSPRWSCHFIPLGRGPGAGEGKEREGPWCLVVWLCCYFQDAVGGMARRSTFPDVTAVLTSAVSLLKPGPGHLSSPHSLFLSLMAASHPDHPPRPSSLSLPTNSPAPPVSCLRHPSTAFTLPHILGAIMQSVSLTPLQLLLTLFTSWVSPLPPGFFLWLPTRDTPSEHFLLKWKVSSLILHLIKTTFIWS